MFVCFAVDAATWHVRHVLPGIGAVEGSEITQNPQPTRDVV